MADANRNLPARRWASTLTCDCEELQLLDRQNLSAFRIPMHRHTAARFGLRAAELVLHFSDEMLAGDCQTIADQGALIDLGIDDCGHVKLTRLAPLEQHVLGPDHEFHPLPGQEPLARRRW